MKLKKTTLITLFTIGLCLIYGKTWAQTDSSQNPLKISAYVDTYYAYNSQQTADHAMPPFLYSYSRNKEFNINLAVLQAQYSDENKRANLGIMTGTYTNLNLATEPGVLKNIYEANIGVKLSKNQNIWLDAGVLPSHIGFESAKGIDNWNLTQTILADNSPYYETGVRLSYTSKNQHWYMAGFATNGWQRIQRLDGNNTIALGHQITYTNEKLTLNSSSFVGNVYPDSVKRMRYYHNLYARYWVSPKLGLTAGVDVGAEQKSKNSTQYNYWYASTAIIRYQFAPKWFVSGRWELFHDKNTTLIEITNPGSFIISGYSANIDFQIHKNIWWRIEAEQFHSKDPIFSVNNNLVRDNYTLTTSLAIAL